MTKGTADRQTRSRTMRERREKEEKAAGDDPRVPREPSRLKQSSLQDKIEGKFEEKVDRIILNMKGDMIPEAL